MSFWYGDINDEKVVNPWDGKPPSFWDELPDFSGLMPVSRADAFGLLIDAPARLIGSQMAPLIGVAFLFLSIFIGLKAGEWIAKRFGKAAGWAAGIFAWLYVSTVLYRSQHWAAFALLENARS